MSRLNNKFTNDRIGKFLFYFPIACLFFLSFLTYLNLTEDTELFGYYAYLEFFTLLRSLKPVFLALLLIKITFFSDYSVKELAASAVFFAVLFFICRQFHPNYFLMYFAAACLSARGVSYHGIAKLYLLLGVTTLALSFAFLAYGLTADGIFERGSIIRHSLGLVHPNSFGMWYMLIVIYFIQYKQDALKTWHLILLLSPLPVVFLLTNSRASLLLSLLALLLAFAEQHLHLSKHKFLMRCLLALVLCIAVLWLILVLIYDSKISALALLNKLTSGRLWLSHQAILDYPPTLFGNNISFPYYVDPLYTYTLVIYGFFGLGLFLAVFYVSAFRAYKKHLPFLLIAFLIFQLYNTQENVFLYHLFDLTMFAATCDLD